jgi:hypothetical protein
MTAYGFLDPINNKSYLNLENFQRSVAELSAPLDDIHQRLVCSFDPNFR